MNLPLRSALLREAERLDADGREATASFLRSLVRDMDARRAGATEAAQGPSSAPAATPPSTPLPPPRDPAQAAAEARRAGERVHSEGCDCRECVP